MSSSFYGNDLQQRNASSASSAVVSVCFNRNFVFVGLSFASE
jgi:hypothetical protein